MTAQLGLGGALSNIIGGIIGVVLFTYLGSFIQEYFVQKFPKRFGRKFTRSNRFLVSIKQKFGLGGIAALTPIFLSIPVGVLFALALTHDKKKILLSMLVSVFFWASVFFVPYFAFHINIIDIVRSVFEK
jgi:hypothetical protein